MGAQDPLFDLVPHLVPSRPEFVQPSTRGRVRDLVPPLKGDEVRTTHLVPGRDVGTRPTRQAQAKAPVTSRNVTATTCTRCFGAILSGLDADVAALHVLLDPRPHTSHPETKNVYILDLVHRRIHTHWCDQPEQAHRQPVYLPHNCDQPLHLPEHLIQPQPQPEPLNEPAETHPPF